MSRAAATVDASKERERTGWGERAQGYGLLTGRITSRLVEPLLDAAGVRPHTRVLDVGTGPGYAAGEAARRGAVVTGVDIADEMVALARRGHRGIRFLRADAEELPFDDGSFDALVGNLVINHLPRPERAMEEFARVVGADGGIALSAWDVPEHTRFLGILLDALRECGIAETTPDRFRFAADDELRALLHGAGLEAIELRTVSLVQHVPDMDELWEGMVGGSARAGTLVMRQPPRTRTRIRARVERLAERHRAADGGLAIPVRAKIASGRKP
jgi:ubiquinone/menaquinone biosynthesis C-methylase UbiE